MTSWKCPTCGNRYDWHHAFAKFGYDDGDGAVETPRIARILEDAGYAVATARFGPHNTIITSIRKNGIEYMPVLDPHICIGYDDPATYLPQEIQNLLNHNVPYDRLFNDT
ncbi:MAG: hypothetical protein KZQ85_08865 [Candidatus Thiodiazotropha sp. (ex Myrtea sp. 'scaly one' KF741663)]|nr:hypothetical protein [Candidatus Thiodiazotropha sp. (ex Myrtea sp. 'scaly one' KF741663)]